MKKWHFFSFLFASLIFSGCSTQQYFILSNATDDTISIQYSFDDPTNPNAIFTLPGEVFQSKKDYQPNWEHQLPYTDLDFSDNNVHIKLGPKSTLIFGSLRNETYDVSSMTSGRGKIFNLKQMKFTVNGVDFLIDKNNFHDFFLEDSGTFKYVIR